MNQPPSQSILEEIGEEEMGEMEYVDINPDEEIPEEFQNETIEKLPEAGGIAWCELYTPGGLRINVTARSVTSKKALDDLLNTITYALKSHGFRTSLSSPQSANKPQPAARPAAPQQAPSRSAAPAPAPATPQAPAPAPASSAPEKIRVTKISHRKSLNGNDFINVKGGRYSKHGLTAWPESLPDEVKTDFVSWDLDTEYAPIPGMEFATTDGKKVMSFSAS